MITSYMEELVISTWFGGNHFKALNNVQSKDEMKFLNSFIIIQRNLQCCPLTRSDLKTPGKSRPLHFFHMIILIILPDPSVNARYPTPPRCIPVLKRRRPPNIYLDYGIEMYRI
jgi:hypothetical protein